MTPITTINIIGVELTTGLRGDYIKLITDLPHPDYSGNLCMHWMVKRGTAIEWLRDELGVEVDGN